VTTAQSSLSQQVDAVEAAMTDLFRPASSRRLHDARQARSGIRMSRTAWEFLRRVDDLGPIRVSQLAELMDLSLAVTSRALHRLQLAELLPRLVAGMRSGTAPGAAQGQA
jgi:hypothetical protein